MWLIIAILCAVVSVSLFLYAWRHRYDDPWLPWHRAPVAPSITCENCRQGIAEIQHTSITGGWNCPACGDAHVFDDGTLVLTEKKP